MEKTNRCVDTVLLMEQYRALLETVDTLPLQVTGSSMTPFLAPGRYRAVPARQRKLCDASRLSLRA